MEKKNLRQSPSSTEGEMTQGLKRLLTQTYTVAEEDTATMENSELQIQLRATVSQQLNKGFLSSHVVDGLVEFLTDVVEADPQQAKLLGID